MKRLAFVIGATLVLLMWVSPAGAHTELRNTDPPAGARLDRAPGRVIVRFTDEVEVSPGGIRVFDSSARRVERGDPYHPDGRPDEAAIDLPELEAGGYVVTWRVVSADSHPIRGAFTFQLESDDDVNALAARLLQESGGDPLVSALFSAVRAVLFGSVLVLVGGAAFIVGLWRQGAANRTARSVLATALGTSAFATIAGVVFHRADGAGLSLSTALSPEVVLDALDGRYGQAAIARFTALCLLAVVLARCLRRDAVGDTTALQKVGLGAGSLLLLASVVLAGHSISGRWVPWAIFVDLIHLAAAAVWIGGLALLATAVLRGDESSAAAVVRRFSRAAPICVLVLLATGSFQSLRQVGTFEALTSTDYGRLLLLKLGAFGAMVVAAARSRSWVRRRGQSDLPDRDVTQPPNDRARLRRSVALETAVAGVVLAMTALLVNAPPGRTALAMPYTAELRAGPDLLVELTFDPAKAGPLDIHLYTLTAAGLPVSAEEVTAELTLRGDIGPIKVPLVRAGPNHFAAYGFTVPIAGQWQLDVAVRATGITIERATGRIPIR